MGGETRRRLLRSSVRKSISSSSSSCSCCDASSPYMRSCSTVLVMPNPLSSSNDSSWLDLGGSSMLSTRSNFRRGFGRGMNCVWCSNRASASACLPCSSSLVVRRCGARTNLFTGLALRSSDWMWSGVGKVGFGVCAVYTFRRLDDGLGLAF